MRLQTVRRRRSDGETRVNVRNVRAGQQTDSDGRSEVELVALENDCRPRLAGIVRPARNAPDFSTLQSDFPSVRHHGVGGSFLSNSRASGEFHHETESTKAEPPASVGLLA